MKNIAATFLLVAFVLAAQASEEGPVPFTNFAIEAKDLNISEEIMVTGKQDDMLLTELKVIAFGQEYFLSRDQLSRLPKGLTYGVQITSEPGYKEFGGRTIYIRIRRGGFPVASQHWLTLTIQKDKPIKVEELKNPTSASNQ